MRFFACFALIAFQCTLGARKGVTREVTSDHYANDSMEEQYANHQDGAETQDIDKMMEGYIEQSKIRYWVEPAGFYWTLSGLDEIRSFLSAGFVDSGRDTLNEISDITDDRQTWTFWEQPDQVECGTDTFIYDDNNIFIRHYVYIAQYPGVGVLSPPSFGSFGVSAHGNGPTQHAWDVHLSSWRSQKIEDILTDYTEDSIMRVFSGCRGTPLEFKGLKGIRNAFERILAALEGVTDLEDTMEDVDETVQVVDWIWRAPSRGYIQAHETVIFDENLKIKRQNVVFRK